MPSARYQKINAHHYHHIWVVSNIYGEYQLLQFRLHQLFLYPETDLLTSTSDNIDCEPKSLNVLRLLNQPWFTPAKGNHETMALDASEIGDDNMWLASSDGRFFGLNDSEQQGATDLLLKFHHPLHIIEITNDNIRYAITHADYPGSEYLFSKEIAEGKLLWSAGRMQKSFNGELQQIGSADYFISGHMMFDNIQTFTNQIYIDTGTSKSGQPPFYKIKQSHASSVKHE